MDVMINIDVDDIGRAFRFYSQAFDLKQGRRIGEGVLELLGASVPIYLLKKPEGTSAAATLEQRRTYARHWTPVHLDFVVDDIEAAVAKAVAAGAILESVIATDVWGRIAHLADPFGHGCCLVQFLGRGYDEIAI